MTGKRVEWTPDAGLVHEVDDLFKRAIDAYRANPNLIREHANHEESIRVGGYSNRTLLELVQNAADAMTGAAQDEEGAGRVEIVLDLDHGTLYCANAGRPFSRTGLTSIAHAHLSAKRGDEIGRFGLGFKSVLAVTDTPQIFSRSISFGFNSPEAKAAIRSTGSTVTRVPVLRTATQLDTEAHFTEDPILEELAEWAATIIKLPHARRTDKLEKEILEFRSEFLLFVNVVREVQLRVIGADNNFKTRHVSSNLGNGKFRIERPEGDHDEWYVKDHMHSPSPEARTEVGEAVSRDKVKVTVAVPARHTQLRLGEFWSYFPLQDRTSASALFNAPWSVNDDRTTLLENKYNREILVALAGIFLDLCPKVASNDDPATHLDYMPARGREIHSFGDGILCAHVPQQGSERALIPDAKGKLCTPLELRPLDFGVVGASDHDHEKWIESPNTADDVPHWRCYRNSQRLTRLRTLYMSSISSTFTDSRSRDDMKALKRIPNRGVHSWLLEWAEGTDATSSANALNFVLSNPRIERINEARVIPTTEGMKSIEDRGRVYLHRVEEIDVDGACFVVPEFLAIPGVEKKLVDRGFRDLDPLAKFQARMTKLSPDSSDDELAQFWDTADDVPLIQARKAVAEHRGTNVKVPTRDGGWALPEYVLDIDSLGHGSPERILDRTRCAPQLAHALGVVTHPVAVYSVDDEIHFHDYCDFVLEELNRSRGPGERPIEEVEFDRGSSAGPFSALLMLKEAEAPDAVRERWTEQLLKLDEQTYWNCVDIGTKLTHRVASPVQWAVRRAGLLNSTRGYRTPAQVVSASLIQYEALLPRFRGPRHVEDTLTLPKDLTDVPAEVLQEALRTAVTLPVKDSTLTEFVLIASRIAFPGTHPLLVPARVGRTIETKRPDAVYLATNDEERIYLHAKQKPYLTTSPEQAPELVETVGCRRFEDSFSFSLLVEGQQSEERVIDLYTGLRSMFVEDKVTDATVTRAGQITKRVTTEGGVEDQVLPWHLDRSALTVRADLSERRILEIINDAFGLGLTNNDLSRILQARADQSLEEQRQQARAASSDAERLEIFFGDDTLKDNLPTGLWHALEAQNLVDDATSVAELFLTVFGNDSIRLLRDQFTAEGHRDVPTRWTSGGATVEWLRKMGFGAQYAARPGQQQDQEFIVPGAVKLSRLHDFQEEISRELREVLTTRDSDGRPRKGMVELPTGAGKTRVVTETALRLLVEGGLRGTVLWIAQSEELCEQAVQTFSTIWRWLGDERPLTIGRLWAGNIVHEPDTEFSVVVAIDAKLNQVADTHEYEWLSRAAAVFIDEAHRAGGSAMYTKILRWLGVAGRTWGRPLVGISATPFKGTGRVTEPTKELAARFGHHKMQAFTGNAYEELSRRRVLARVRHEVLPGVTVSLKPDELKQVQSWRKLESTVMERIGRDQARMRILVDHILSQDPEWPILVFTPSILSAQVLAATLRYRKVAAAAVSGQTGRQTRRDVIEDFKQGKIRVLANCDLLVQGFDAPGVRALYIARPTFSPSAYIQMAGRGLRGPANGGKEECLIVDVADNFGAVNDFLGYHEYEDLWQRQGA